MSTDTESVERVIASPPEPIFDLLADPHRHPEIDGSGSVKSKIEGPDRLSLGAKFQMAMKLVINYKMESEIIEFEENRRIAWQSRPANKRGESFGGRIWRYELEPTAEGTRVRETWDISQEKIKAMVRPARKKTRKAMEATLARIEEIVSKKD